jgi:MtN3 and saliva related transmembrane protein
MNMTSVNRMMTLAALLPGALVLGGCATIGIHDTESLFAPSFQRSEIVGFVAGFGTTFAAIPDLVKMIQRRSSRGINPTMASIMAVFQIAWIYYGLLTVSRPVIVWNVVGVATNSLTVWAYRRFSRRERQAGRR